MGAQEIAERHGIQRHRVFRLRRRGLWPAPVASLHCGEIYDGREIEQHVSHLRRQGHLD